MALVGCEMALVGGKMALACGRLLSQSPGWSLAGPAQRKASRKLSGDHTGLLGGLREAPASVYADLAR